MYNTTPRQRVVVVSNYTQVCRAPSIRENQGEKILKSQEIFVEGLRLTKFRPWFKSVLSSYQMFARIVFLFCCTHTGCKVSKKPHGKVRESLGISLELVAGNSGFNMQTFQDWNCWWLHIAQQGDNMLVASVCPCMFCCQNCLTCDTVTLIRVDLDQNGIVGQGQTVISHVLPSHITVFQFALRSRSKFKA